MMKIAQNSIQLTTTLEVVSLNTRVVQIFASSVNNIPTNEEILPIHESTRRSRKSEIAAHVLTAESKSVLKYVTSR